MNYNRNKIGRFAKISKIKNWICKITKRAIIGMFVLQLCGWSLYLGSQLIPVTVMAEKEVTKPIKMEDIPMLVKICKAESGLRQFNAKGDVLRGKVNRSDIGICQISEYTWNDTARRMGMDIYTEEGNKAFAVWLFLQQGTKPWESSKNIVNGWGK